MGIKYTTTSAASKWVKCLVYGKSGVGKTRLCLTAPAPIIISSENKLMSLAEENIPVIVVKTIADLEKAIDVLERPKFERFKTVCIDSLSDITESAILKEKANHADPRKAYMVVQDRIYALLRKIRESELEKHFYVIAKATMVQNEDQVDMYSPSMPGQKMGKDLAYHFDFVFPLRVADTDDDNTARYTYLQTTILDDLKYEAKAATANLNPKEEPNLSKLFAKIRGEEKTKKPKKKD